MKRDIFVRIATKALQMSQGQPPTEQAEAIATLMDTFAEVMGEEASAPAMPPAVRQTAALNGPAFPAPNPAAFAIADPEPVIIEQQAEPPAPSLIVTDQRMPAPHERARAAAPQAQIAKPATGGMKVEELSRLVQERTPERLTLEFSTEDGYPRRTVWARNVISRHSFGSVNLIYAPLGASASVRELSEVSAVISIEDLPVDLTAIVTKLRDGAIHSITPRGPIMSMTPPTGARPVNHPADTYKDPGLTTTVSGVFDASVGVAPANGSPGYKPIY